MKNFALALSGLAAISAAPAFAETTYLSFGLGYSELSVASETIANTIGVAAFERKSGKFTYGGELARDKLAASGGDANSFEISAYLGYDVTSTITVFAGASDAEFGEFDRKTRTAGAEYTAGAFTFGAAYITRELEGTNFNSGQVYAEYNSDDLSAYASVVFDDDYELYLAGFSRDTTAYQADLDVAFAEGVELYKLSGSYNLRENLRLNASVDYADSGDSDTMQTSVGAGYMVADNIWLDASYNTIKSNGENADGFGVKVSYEMGKTRLRAADRVDSFQDMLSSVLFLGRD